MLNTLFQILSLITRKSHRFQFQQKEAPGVNSNWPSDISFYLNDTLLGIWTSPGDYGDVRGMFTPEWWPAKWNQYGLLKLLVINRKGTFIDGLKISDVTINTLNLDYKNSLHLKMA